MRDRISDRTRDKFKKSIRDVVKGLSRRVEVFKQPLKTECYNCYFDKLTGTSTGKCRWSIAEAEQKQIDYELTNPGVIRYKWFSVGRCPVCKGLGYIETKRKVWVRCLVVWDPDVTTENQLIFLPAGQEGASVVQLKTDPRYLELFRDCSKIVVDGLECKLSKPPTSRGLGNESLLIVYAFTSDKMRTNSGEIIKDYD